MFFEHELDRHIRSLDYEFSPKELSAIFDQALIDLKDRSIAGAAIVPLAFLVGGFATDYSSEQLYLFTFLGCILCVATLLRIASIFAFSKQPIVNHRFWVPVFSWSNIFMGFIWGLFSASSVFFYHDSLHISLTIILLAGISSGSMASYCIWKLLSYSYLLLILVPTIVVEFYIGNKFTVPIGVAISFFLSLILPRQKSGIPISGFL